MTPPHISVLSAEILSFFSDHKLQVFVDGTLGAGGHSAAILAANPELDLLIGIDQDPQALEIAKHRLAPWSEKTKLIRGNFRELPVHLDKLGIKAVDGMLFDIGVSSMQLDIPEKGFSFSQEGPLDMRMDPSAPLTAEEIVNTWTEEKLGWVFREYGEEKRWRQAARAIVVARGSQPIKTTTELAAILRPHFFWNKKGINPLTLIFQGLRICVNGELDALEQLIPAAIERLRPGGRLCVISFHSLEDRIVKNRFRYEASDKEDTSGVAGMFIDKEPRVRLLTRKPIMPTEQEVEMNPRSRSAKLRVVEKI
jgi:16S rRNA (cytosine1402-N4)-methyltransferase